MSLGLCDLVRAHVPGLAALPYGLYFSVFSPLS